MLSGHRGLDAPAKCRSDLRDHWMSLMSLKHWWQLRPTWLWLRVLPGMCWSVPGRTAKSCLPALDCSFVFGFPSFWVRILSTGPVSLWFLLFEVRYELCKADNPVALERQLAPCSCDSTAGKAQLPQKFLFLSLIKEAACSLWPLRQAATPTGYQFTIIHLSLPLLWSFICRGKNIFQQKQHPTWCWLLFSELPNFQW